MAGRTKREEVYIKAGGRCAICGRPLALDEMTIDHTKAQSSFGKGEVRNDIENLACFCRECNAAKADMTPKKFRKFVNTRNAELSKLEAEKRKLERSLRALTQEYEAKVRRINAKSGELQKEIDSSRFSYIRYLREQEGKKQK
ncbi:MAG: HNH endonuclease [Candidatus Cryptobacteroides sp.]